MGYPDVSRQKLGKYV